MLQNTIDVVLNYAFVLKMCWMLHGNLCDSCFYHAYAMLNERSICAWRALFKRHLLVKHRLPQSLHSTKSNYHICSMNRTWHLHSHRIIAWIHCIPANGESCSRWIHTQGTHGGAVGLAKRCVQRQGAVDAVDVCQVLQSIALQCVSNHSNKMAKATATDGQWADLRGSPSNYCACAGRSTAVSGTC